MPFWPPDGPNQVEIASDCSVIGSLARNRESWTQVVLSRVVECSPDPLTCGIVRIGLKGVADPCVARIVSLPCHRKRITVERRRYRSRLNFKSLRRLDTDCGLPRRSVVR